MCFAPEFPRVARMAARGHSGGMTDEGAAHVPTAAEIEELLNGIHGVRAAIADGLRQGRRGEGIPLDELADEEER